VTAGRGWKERSAGGTTDDRERIRGLRLGYRPGLDGIRAVAVLAVMLFHAGVSWIPGGFLGVDLFFVLSGFLITTLLLEEWAISGTIRLGPFWGRRARRLFPALALVLGAIAVYGVTLAPVTTRAGLRWDGLASLFYVANWRFILGHESYFAAFAAPSPLRHLWSLAVEEQWYLVWPPTLALILAATRRLSTRRTLEVILGLLVGLTVLSAAQMLRLDVITSGAADSARSYYGTDTHIQVLLVGAVLAVGRLRWPPRRTAIQRRWRRAGVVGAALCVAMFLTVAGSARWMYRGGFTLFAVAGALVVATAVIPRSGALGRALRLRPLRAVGRISYGLYLWHWPVDVCLNPTRVHLGAGALLLLRTGVTGVIAVASYYCVELPIRTRRFELRRPLRQVTLVLGILALAFGLVPLIGAIGSSTPSEAATGTPSPIAASPGGTLVPVTAAGASTTRPGAPAVVIPAVAQGQPVRVLVVGDSVGVSLTNQVVAPPPLELANESREGCGITFGAAIVDGYPIYDVSQCPQAQQNRDWLAGLATKPDVVVMSFGTWDVFDQQYDGHDYKAFSTDYARLLGGQLQTDVNFLRRYSNSHIALLDVPCYSQTNYGLGGAASPRLDPKRVAWVNHIFATVASANPGRVSLIPISQWVCPGGTFRTTYDGVVLRPDGVHYDPESAALTWRQWLGPRITALARTAVDVRPRGQR
jgi:peptidoglycan/LPS O-acetylase OafA/YrhL